MVLLIDGYNLLKQIFPGSKGRLDKQRAQLIKELVFYKEKKPAIKEVILVFDAGPYRHALREIHDMIIVIFSGQQSCADTWIQNYVYKHKNISEILLITQDRKLKESCQQPNVHSMDVLEFYKILQDNLYEEVVEELNSSSPLKKYSLEETFETDIPLLENNKALDLLMEEASINMPEKEINSRSSKNTKGSAFKPSKKQRKKITLKKKLT